MILILLPLLVLYELSVLLARVAARRAPAEDADPQT
jgi:Sec-independent protein secretion pathway component TatC